MVAELRDRTYAECCQLMSEYDPDPPFNAGSMEDGSSALGHSGSLSQNDSSAGPVWFPLGGGTTQMSVRVTKLIDLFPRLGLENTTAKLCPGSFKASSNVQRNRNELAWS